MKLADNKNVIIGFLVALLVVLNVIVPLLKKSQANKQATAVESFLVAYQTASPAQQQALIADYQVKNKSLALSASADGSECAFWYSMWRSYYFSTLGQVRHSEWVNYLEDRAFSCERAIGADEMPSSQIQTEITTRPLEE